MKDVDEKDYGKMTLSSFAEVAKPVITLDIEKYQHFLDNSGMNPEERRAFLEALWSIIVAFVDLGFGVHPLQEACGQTAETLTSIDHQATGDARIDHVTLTQKFNTRPADDTAEEEIP